VNASGSPTSAIGSSGVRPGPSLRGMEIWPSVNGVSHDMFMKRSAHASLVFSSTLEMQSLILAGVCGAAIQSVEIRPSEGSSESNEVFDGVSYLSV
jgi:hypothetical protein